MPQESTIWQVIGIRHEIDVEKILDLFLTEPNCSALATEIEDS